MDIAKMTINFDLPTHWLHGMGYAQKTGELLKERNAKAPLVLTGPIVRRTGVIDPVLESLDAHGFKYEICDLFATEPTVKFFDDTVKDLNLSRFDAVVAVGGGSIIDSAKALAVVAKFGGSIRQYAGKDQMPGRPDWINISIPTTAGTGSEVSDGAVFIDEEEDTKFIMMSKRACPNIALTDPELSKTMPASVTAYSGVDALVHAIESYTSRFANLATEKFALQAIAYISKYLPIAYKDGSNMEARSAMQMGSTMAMISASNAYCGLCHSMAMPLCGLYHMIHGQGCGMSLPFVLKYNAAVTPQKVETVFKTMNLWDTSLSHDEAMAQGFLKLEKFLNDLGIITRLSHFNCAEKDLDHIARATLGSIQCAPNPRTPTREDIIELARSFM